MGYALFGYTGLVGSNLLTKSLHLITCKFV